MSIGVRNVVGQGNEWDVKKDGVPRPESRHRTQGAAEQVAKRTVRSLGGGEVRIQGRDG